MQLGNARRGGCSGYDGRMARKVWTAEELGRMSPAEQDRIFQAGIVRDLRAVPEDFHARVRGRLDERIAGSESPAQ